MKKRLNGLVIAGAVVIAAAWASANANSGKELLFSAPLQKVDRGAGTVTLLGQTFQADTSQLSIGEIAKVYGVLQKDGSVSDAVVQGTGTYGANGDSVFLKGVVTQEDTALGHVEIDGLTVDYTSQLANAQFAPPAIGDVIAISGLQPTSQGLLVADATGAGAYTPDSGAGQTSRLPVSALQQSLATAQMGGSLNAAQMGGSLNTAQMGGSLNTAQMGGSLNTAQMGGSLNTAQMGGSLNTAQMGGSAHAAQMGGSALAK